MAFVSPFDLPLGCASFSWRDHLQLRGHFPEEALQLRPL